MEAANLLKATKVLNIEPDWLQFGTGRMRPQLEMQQLDFDYNVRFVPLLSYTQAVNPMEKNEDVISNVGLDDQLAQIASPASFALLIKDNSMLPLFVPGDVIIIDPAIQPSPGEFVAAKIRNQDSLIFRKYRLLYINGSHQFELIALNEDWGKIVITNHEEGEIIGTLIEHRSKRRILDPHEIVQEF
jgi:SOS-response transcriptional repressor LexA